MNNNNLYNEFSIEHKDPREFTRLKPQVYVGSTEYTTQLMIEIISNSIDEVKLKHGNLIEIGIKNNQAYWVRDYGQGILPNVFKEDGKTILEKAFSEINTSGKYTNDGVYNGTSLGNFGIGSKLQNYLSIKSIVSTYKDGEYETIEFKDGLFKERKQGKTQEKNGIYVYWEPDPQFFQNTSIDLKYLKSYLKETTALCYKEQLKIILDIDGQKETYVSKNGLNDLIDSEITPEMELINNRLNISFSDNLNEMDFVMTYTNRFNSTIIPYINIGKTERGPHITQIKALLTREFNRFFKEKKWIKESDSNFSGDDIQEGLYIIFNFSTQNVKYNAQVKTTVTEIDISPFTKVIAEELRIWLAANEKDIKIIADKAKMAKKAREAAAKARDAIREKQNKKEKALKFDSKLADCFSKDRKKCEIFIVEGDSASGNLKTARDNEFQAVLPIRGKILNTHKASIDKIQKNAEIMTMIDAFGLEIDPKTMKVTYDKNKIRYGKIIIMSDADSDGSHIKNLFYTFIWNFCPQLIEDGFIYAGVPPLYKITTSKGYQYLKNDEALDEYRKNNVGKKYQVNRFKGLGELDVEETEETLANPEQRIIRQVTISDTEKAKKLFDDLMGTAVTPRKDYIKTHSEEAKYNVE